jgi:hypothetical protein
MNGQNKFLLGEDDGWSKMKRRIKRKNESWSWRSWQIPKFHLRSKQQHEMRITGNLESNRTLKDAVAMLGSCPAHTTETSLSLMRPEHENPPEIVIAVSIISRSLFNA